MLITEIKYEEVFSSVRMLSSFEAREAYTASGEDDYERVHVTEQDRPWISSHVLNGSRRLLSILQPIADDLQDDGCTVVLSSQQVCAGKPMGTIRKTLFEYLVSYVLCQWCKQYLPERVQVYTDLMADMEHTAQKEMHRLSVPVKRRRVKNVDINKPIISVTHESPQS